MVFRAPRAGNWAGFLTQILIVHVAVKMVVNLDRV